MSEAEPAKLSENEELLPKEAETLSLPMASPLSGWEAFRVWAWEKLKDPDRLRGRLDYQTYLLAAAGLVASLVLGLGDLSTKHAIEARQREDLLATLSQVLPDRIHDNDLLKDRVFLMDEVPGGLGSTEVYLAKKGVTVTGVAFKMVALGGYSGPISLMVGLDAQGQVLGVRVISHAETPGLGDKIETAKSDWIESFQGRSLVNPKIERWRVKKDGGEFDQFAGATITPRAVVSGIARGLEFFDRHRAALIGHPTP